MLTLLLAAVPLATAADPAPAKYARPEILAVAADLATPTGRAKVRVLDVRSPEKYAAGHVPGAVPAPLAAWAKAITDGKADAAFWKANLAAVGVAPDRPTVVYAEDVRDAAKAWWFLHTAGVPDVRLLNGGWAGYVAAKGEVDKTPATATADPHDWKVAPERVATKDDLLKLLKDGNATIVDARSGDEFTGEKMSSKRGGHVPGAAHLEWTDLIDAKTTEFKPAADLAKLIADRKIDLSKRCVTYCQGGGRAAVMAFGLRLMGADDVRNYYRSWGEWGNDPDTPVAKPAK